MSGDRRSRSRSLRRRSYSRSRSRNRSKSADKAKQPCVFYFSKEAKGCKFSGRDCKFSHDKYDYENWNKDGRDLPNTGLIFRETPVYPSDRRRSRSRSRKRSYSRSRSRSRSRSPRKKRIRERSFTLSPIRDGGYQPQGFSRTTRGFVNIPPDHVEKYVIDARDLKKRRKSESVRNGRSRSRDSKPSKSSKHVSPAQKRIVKQERRSRSSSKPSRSKSPKKAVKQQKSKKDAKKKSKRKRKSSTSSSSNSSSDSESESKPTRKETRIEHSNGIEFIDTDMTFKEAMKNQGKRDKTITREVKQEMSITKARQMILHLNEKSGEKPIFHHVDCSKLPQNPESAPQSTSVAGGNLLAAMFGTADDEEDELQGDSSEPEKLREKKAELAKTEKPRGTTGIAINDRITWWQKMGKKSEIKTPKKAKKAKKDKKKRKVSESDSSESDSPVKQEKKDSRKSSKSRKSSRKQSPSIKKERRDRSRSMSISRSPSPVRRRSPVRRPARRRSLSRSMSRSRSPSRRRESRSGSESMDEARKPCVFYFSKNAQGCRFAARDCKFSHDKYDYDYWNRSGRDLPNTGLIERTKPLRDNRRSYTPDRRRY